MRVLFLTDGLFPFQLGGMQKHSTILIQLLLDNGIHVNVVHCGGEGYSEQKFNELFDNRAGEVHETMILFPKLGSLPGHYVRENKKYSTLIFEAFKQQLQDFDLIYSQGFTAYSFLKGKSDSIPPVLLNFHGFEMFQMAPNFKVKLQHYLLRPAVKFCLKHADYVYSFGAKIDEVLDGLGVGKDRIILQSNGINKDWIRSNPPTAKHEPFRFVFIGRNERRKGFTELLEAIKGFKDNVSYEFHFIGPLPNDMQSDHLIFHGEIRDAERIKDILDQSDCLVCPSHSEGMPTVILEAMSRGLAVIATDVGAVSRQIGDNGILLDNAEPEKIRQALNEMIGLTNEEIISMKQQSIQLIEQDFVWERIAEKKISQFKEILSKLPK